MKTNRRMISLLLAVLLVVTACSAVLAQSVFTASAASGDTIYFRKPADWNDKIYVHWWNSGSDTTFPGRAMTKLSDDIYSFKVTTTFTDFNINDGGDTVSNPHQTVNLKFPGNGKLGVVGTSAGKNSYGNECWNLKWESFMGIGLSVSASVADCEFLDSLSVKLGVCEAENGYYVINNGEKTAYTDGQVITIGKDGKAGDKYVLTLTAGEGADTVSKTYTYVKTDSPIGASIVYFDNSEFKWDDVYCYAYGTKENAEWPGQLMFYDSESDLYYITFDEAYKSENILFTNGLEEEEEGYGKYPKASGLSLKVGECKLLTSELQWIDYGKPDSKPYGFAYTASGTKFSTDTINVDIDLKNAVKGVYSIDGGSEFDYTERTTVTVGQGVIGNSEIILTLKATAMDGTETTTQLKYYKTFAPKETSYYSPSDGSTTKAIGGYYKTNPEMQLGKYNSAIKVDGDPSDWNSSMLVAQGVANDDPRVYMPSSIHERSVDDYALYASWDDTNLYFMWEMANVSAVLGGKDIFSAQKPNGSIWNPGLPVYMVLSVDPAKHADGKARELNIKTQTWVESSSVWDSGISFDTNVDTFITMDTANTNGGMAIIPLDDEGFFNYTESTNIGRPTNDPGVLNRNDFKIAWDYGTLSDNIYGVNGFGSSRTIGDTYTQDSQWIDFLDAGYKKDAGFIYEISIPMEHLGIDRNYIETKGIGAMLISTFGTSGMNTLPHDPAVLDNADQEYSLDPSTTHEKEDADKITVPLARIGALLPDSVIEETPLELNFGADKAGAQGVNTEILLKAEVYGTDEDYTLAVTVDGKALSVKDNTAKWTPAKTGTYKVSATVTTESGKSVTKTFDYAIGEAVEVIIPPETEPTVIPTTTVSGDNTPSESTVSTDPSEDNTEPSNPVASDPSEVTTVPTLPVDTNPEDTSVSDTPIETLPDSSSIVIVFPTTKPMETEKVLLGDVDANGKITIKDATMIQKHIAKIDIFEGGVEKSADAFTDGKINVKDVTIIQKFIAKYQVEYPVGEYIE